MFLLVILPAVSVSRVECELRQPNSIILAVVLQPEFVRYERIKKKKLRIVNSLGDC